MNLKPNKQNILKSNDISTYGYVQSQNLCQIIIFFDASDIGYTIFIFGHQ